MGNTITIAEEVLPIVQDTKDTVQGYAKVVMIAIILHFVFLSIISIALILILLQMRTKN